MQKERTKLPLDINKKVKINNVWAMYNGISDALTLQEIYDVLPLYEHVRENYDVKRFFKEAYERVCYKQYAHLNPKHVAANEENYDGISPTSLADTVDTYDFIAKCGMTVDVLMKQINELQREELERMSSIDELENHMATIVISNYDDWSDLLAHPLDENYKKIEIMSYISEKTGIADTLE